MTSARTNRGHSAARTGSLKRKSIARWAALTVALAVLGAASGASALVITGGPVYSLPGGGSCSVSGVASQGTGATLSCTGVVLTGHTHVYLGIKNDVNVNGNVMTGSLAAASAAVFRSSSTTSSSITYTSTTTVASNIPLFGTDPVTSTLVLTRTAGTGSPVSTGGTPANNANGDIGHLFEITSAGTFTLDVDVLAASPHFSGQACPAVYDPSHAASAPNGEISQVDIAFYYSDCGDGVIDSPEQCDLGSGTNGQPTACCSSSCTFTSGNTCRASAGVCDLQETCSGSSSTCPADSKSTALCRASGGVCDLADSCDGTNDDCPADAKSTALCRASAGGCDVVENCDGVGDDCPGDVVQASGFVCDAGSGDVCDPDETCDGSNAACPSDTITPGGTVCRTGSGDSCDPDETCTGTADDPCPADVVESASTVCRPGSGDACDPDEFCPGVPAGTCAADVVAPGGTVCNPGSGDMCDPDEVCPGVPAGTCAADTVTSGSTVCRAAGGVCDVTENCPGTADQPCPADAKAASGTSCRASTGFCDIAEVCDGATDACPTDTGLPDDTPCGDGLYCNGDETCQSNVCADGPNPCTFVCDEPTDTCLSTACPALPTLGCRTAQKAKLIIKDKTDNNKDKLIWKFIKGQNTTFAELQDPEVSANYTLCIYAGTAPAIINVPPNAAKWTIIGANKGYKYLDTTGAAAGVQKVISKASAVGKTKHILKAKGANMPDILGPGPITGLTTPVTAQLLNHDSGVCWTSQFNTAIKNTPTLFKAKQ